MKEGNIRTKWISVLMIVAMIFLSVAGFFPAKVSAASSGEIKKQLQQLKEEKAAIVEEMERIKGQINENQSEMETMVQKKDVIDQQIALKYQEVSNITEQIAAYNLLIADKQEELEKAEAAHQFLSDKYRQRIRAMEENGEVNYWAVLFNANSFSDFLDRLNMIEEIATADQARLKELREAAEAVEKARSMLETEKQGLEETQKELTKAQAQLEEHRKEADAILAALVAAGAAFEDLLEESEEKQTQLMMEIAKKQSEYDKAKYQEWLSTSVPSTKPSGSIGSTQWKVPIRYTRFSSPFGYRIHPKTGKWTMHYGVDLAAPMNTPIYASRSGIVSVAAYQHNGAGHYIQINHGDGYRSIYMHMTRYVVKAGQTVNQGQLIGYCGSSGLSSGPHLHFGISYNGTYVNPAKYIPI